MANPNLTRVHQKIFAENAITDEIGVFGSLQAGTKLTSSNIATLQSLAAYGLGFSDATTSGEQLPSLEEVNGLHKTETEQLQYLLNKGIPEYSADAEYYIDDIQREVGGTKLYKSITDHNIGNALTDALNWQELGDLADLINLNQATTTTSGFSLLPKQITIENDSVDTDHDILFNAGNFQFDDGSGQAVLSSNLRKRIDEAWVAGSDQGGLFSGTVAANSTYHMFVISNDDGSLVDAGFSSDVNAADIPTGYTKKRRIASLRTDASDNIRAGQYIFNNDSSYRFIYDTEIIEGTSISSTNQNLPLTIPDNIFLVPLLTVRLNVGPSVSRQLIINDKIVNIAENDSRVSNYPNHIFTSTSIVTYRVDNTLGVQSLSIETNGWIDHNL
jgi:hypothetical protein